MPTKILTQNNKILTKDSRVILQPQYKENLIQTGLTNYYKSGDMVFNGNYVSRWNDSISGNHLIQNNQTLQLKYFPNTKNGYGALNGYNTNYLDTYISYFNLTNNQTVKSFFGVFYNQANSFNWSNGTSSEMCYRISPAAYFDKGYSNGLLKTTSYLSSYAGIYDTYYKYVVIYISFTTPITLLSTTPTLGATSIGYIIDCNFLELAYYNRTLSNEEVLYNSNALMQKFNIT